MKNNLFIVSGPSGAGEDSVIEGLKQYFKIERVITTTSREMRSGESQKNPYYFISKEEFEQGIKDNKFFEWAREYNDNLYGVTHEEIERVKKSGKIAIWKIEYKGVMTAKKLIPDIIAILISAPLEILEKRIKDRNPEYANEFVQDRLNYTKKWLENRNIYDFEVENEQGKLDQTIKKVAEIIKQNASSSY